MSQTVTQTQPEMTGIVKVLNPDQGKRGEFPLPAQEVSRRVQRAMLRMTGKFISEKTGKVDYKGLKKSQEYEEYRCLASRLREVDLTDLGECERATFFINIYNALTVDSIAQLSSTPASTLEVDHFWTSHAYTIGAHAYTLDQIEHGVLRGNRAHPTSGRPVLATGDPRLAHALTKPDPRLHFALNCGAKTCPAVRVYSVEQLEAGLEGATVSYLQQEVTVKDGRLQLPQILQWYMTDFGPSLPALLRWIRGYVGTPEKEAIDGILGGGGDAGDISSSNSPLDFFYDWSLNAAECSPVPVSK